MIRETIRAKSTIRMKKLSITILMFLAAFIAFAAYTADCLFGVVAFTYGYFTFCLLTALALGGVWHLCSRKFGTLFGVAVFIVLSTNFFLPPPSERLLRSAMLKITPGTDASAIVDIVRQEYEGSPYVMPWIHEDRAGGYDRVHVSLLSQRAGNCTAVIFLIVNGQVSHRIFSLD